MDYFDPNNYIESYHWHIDFKLNNVYIEAIGLKRINGTWDIFFDDTEYSGLFTNTHPRLDFFGAFLFNTTENDTEKLFQEWVINKLVPYLNHKCV